MDTLLDEIDSLEAILMDDVKIVKNPETGFPELIETTIFPIVGEDTDTQYVCVTLQVMPNLNYPDISPKFELIRPRGLDDLRLNEIKTACIKKLSDSLGYPVVFDLIDIIREHLTGSNLPSGQCVICLYGFKNGDEFIKTKCYHYLHSYCLARHLIASRKNYQDEHDKLPQWLKKMSDPFQATCPVCREAITDDSDNLKNSKPPSELENAPEFHLTDDLKELQARMTNLYLKQKNRGAIIDPEAEDCNVISLGPIDDDNFDDNNMQESNNYEFNKQCSSIDSSTTIKDNDSDSTFQTSAQSIRRSNSSQNQQHQQQQRQIITKNNNSTSQSTINNNSNSSSKYLEDSSSSSNNSHSRYHHHRRHHQHHYHHRSRRQQIHHLSNNQNNDSSHHQQQQDNSTTQQKTNVRATCGTGSR